MKITVACVGYVGLSLAVLLAQNHDVTAITTTLAKADKLNSFYSPIQDDEIERFFAEARNGERELSLHTTTDKAAAYGNADLVIIATPTNYDDVGQFFDTSAVEDAIEQTLAVNPDVMMVIKSTIPVGYTDHVREKYGIDNIIFSPEFLRESKALYDNLHPSRIVVGAYDHQKEAAQMFADLLLEGARTEERRAGQEPQNIPILIATRQRLRLSSCLPTHIWQYASATSMSSIHTHRQRTSIHSRSSMAFAWTLVLAATTTTRRSGTVDTACLRTPSSCWLTTRMFRRQ